MRIKMKIDLNILIRKITLLQTLNCMCRFGAKHLLCHLSTTVKRHLKTEE